MMKKWIWSELPFKLLVRKELMMLPPSIRNEGDCCDGGIHVTAVPDEAALRADAIVVGEAEDTWPELINDFENNRLKKRYEKPARDSLKNLPYPRFDLIDPQKYIRSFFNPMPLIPYKPGGGAPTTAILCNNKVYGAKNTSSTD